MKKMLNSMSISFKLIAMVCVIAAFLGATITVLSVRDLIASEEQALVEEALAFTAVAEAAKNHASDLNEKQVFNSKDLLAEVEDYVAKGRDYKEARIFGTIPVVAGWTAAASAAKEQGINFKTPAFDARNHDNDPSRDSEAGAFRASLLKQLQAQVDAGNTEPVHAIDEANNNLHVMRPILLDQSCLLCHGDPKDSPTGDGKDILGFPMENWKAGDMHGAYEVIYPLDKLQAHMSAVSWKSGLVTLGLVAGCGVLLFLMMRVTLTKPINSVVALFKDIATGDLSKRMDVDRNDEIGQLGQWTNKFLDAMRDMMTDVKSASTEVASAATEIAAASEEMASSMVQVADQSEKASSQAASSGQVAEKGGAVVSDTIKDMRSISEAVSAGAASVSELGKRGEQIGQIIAVINDIADQTNLLALNAAIEAARAGEHGRGFAVVADEVSKLADRTTKATDEIAVSIRAIQTETGQAVQRA